MDTTTTTTSSICNDILSYLTSNHSTFPLNSINVQTSASSSSDSLFSYSPTTVHNSDLISDAYKSLWSPKQGEVGKVALRDGSSSEEMSCSLLPLQSDQETVGRYKTELCRPFEENGFCKYGNRCQFAHGRQELRDVDRHPKYKTQLCKTFHTTGICRYGKRCHFIHNEDEGGNKTQRQSPQQEQQQQQQQQHPVSGLRKLTGRQNTKSAEEEEQQQQQQLFQAYSIFPTSSISSSMSSTSRYFEEQSSPVVSNRMSLPSSTSSSPSPSLASFSDDAFFQSSSLFSAATNDNISQMPPICWRKTSTSPSFSSLPGSIDLFSYPLSVRPTMPTESSSSSSSSSFSSSSVQQKGISSSSSNRGDEDQESCQREVVDLILRHLNKSQMEQLLVNYLLAQTQKRNASI